MSFWNLLFWKNKRGQRVDDNAGAIDMANRIWNMLSEDEKSALRHGMIPYSLYKFFKNGENGIYYTLKRWAQNMNND